MAICSSSRSPVPSLSLSLRLTTPSTPEIRPLLLLSFLEPSSNSRSICYPGDNGSCGQRRVTPAFAFAAPEPTVTHTPESSGESVSVTVPLTGVSVLTTYIRWSDNYSLGSLFSADGAEQILSLVDLNSSSPAGRVVISISGINRRFTPAFEASGQIIFEASDGGNA